MARKRGRALRRERERTKAKKSEPPPLPAGPARQAWKGRLRHAIALVITGFFFFQLYDFSLFYNETKLAGLGLPKALEDHSEFANVSRAVKLMYKPDSFIYYNSMLSMRGDREFEHRYRHLRAGYTILGVAVSRVIPIDPVEALPFVSLVLMGAVLLLIYLISGSVLAPAFCFLWGNLWAEWGFLVLPDTAGVLFMLLALWFRFRDRTLMSLVAFAVGLLMREYIVFVLPLLLTGGRLDKRTLTIAAAGILAIVVLQTTFVTNVMRTASINLTLRTASIPNVISEVILAFQVGFGAFAYKLAFLVIAFGLIEGWVLPSTILDTDRRVRDLHLALVFPLNLLPFLFLTEDLTARYLIYSVPSVVVLSISLLQSVWQLLLAALEQESADISGARK